MKCTVTWVLAATVLLGAACGNDYGVVDMQQIYVKIGEVGDPDEYNFQKIRAKDPALKVWVTVSNTGSKTLTVSDIYLEEGGNPHISLDFTDGAYDPEAGTGFPVVMDPESDKMITFKVVYDPEDGVVESDQATLVIVSDDPRFGGSDEGKRKIVLGVENVGPKLAFNRSSIIYSCATGCVNESITIDNEGTDLLEINSIEFGSTSVEFALPNPPKMPMVIPVKSDADYFSLTFDIRYCPEDSDFTDSNSLVVRSNEGVAEVPISVEQAPAVLVWTTDSPVTYFDFGGEGGTHTLNLYNKTSDECKGTCMGGQKCCGCPVQVQRVDLTVEGTVNDTEAAAWYEWKVLDTNTGNSLNLPRAVKGGGSLGFEVIYHRPAGQTTDRNGKICVAYLSPISGSGTRCVDLIAASSCDLEVAPVNQLLYFNTENPAVAKQKSVVLINSGAGACNIPEIAITDKWDAATPDFSLVNAPALPLVIPPFGISLLDVEFAPKSATSGSFDGLVKMQYEDTMAGMVPFSVILKGAMQQDCAAPTANPGSKNDYGTITVGSSVTLNGCGSAAGTCGSSIYETGYVWFIMARPEGSSAKLNVEDDCFVEFSPDKAGDYQIGLIVYEGTTFLQSDLATVTITAE